MDADLVLDGGGVKGVALAGAYAGLDEAGVSVHRVAGSSAGAIVGALIAAGVPSSRLTQLARELDYRKFADEGVLDHLGLPGKALSVLFEKGVYEGRYFRDWLDALLKDLGKRTFGDLRLDDPEDRLPPGRGYRLVVIVSDVTRGVLVRLPWDYPAYGLDPDEQLVADAVHASSAIPFVYEPVKLDYRGEQGHKQTAFLVDGGLLSNFPVDLFDPTDGKPPRRPTFGIKLSARPESAQQQRFAVHSTYDFAKAVLGTVLTAQDQMHIDDPCVQGRTIFVDTTGVRATDFDLTPEERQRLFDSGVAATRKFLATWDFQKYLRRCPHEKTP